MAKGLNERIEEIIDKTGDLNARLKEQIDAMIDICGTVKALAEQIREAVGQDPPSPPFPPHPRWKPKKGEKYCFLFGGACAIGKYTWEDLPADYNSYNASNVYANEEAAGFVLERRKVLNEMREWAGKWCDTWCIYYTDGRIEPFSVRRFNDITYGEMRFASEADARNCIKAVGEERLKKYYFMITEGADENT